MTQTRTFTRPFTLVLLALLFFWLMASGQVSALAHSEPAVTEATFVIPVDSDIHTNAEAPVDISTMGKLPIDPDELPQREVPVEGMGTNVIPVDSDIHTFVAEPIEATATARHVANDLSTWFSNLVAQWLSVMR